MPELTTSLPSIPKNLDKKLKFLPFSQSQILSDTAKSKNHFGDNIPLTIGASVLPTYSILSLI